MPKVAMLNTKILKYKLKNKKVYTMVYTFYFFA